ncbi:MAG: hypothetical protein SFU25_09865, partial [Candidatus Caenarcaniphilales bacterium]|nr:hypothetical protein [Candidatus Caenarcaniphilales bacterium]
MKFLFFLIFFGLPIFFVFAYLSTYFLRFNAPFYKNSKQTLLLKQEKFLIISHRGFNVSSSYQGERNIKFENTPQFIKSALESYDGVEFDLHLLKSKSQKEMPVLLHNDFLDLYGAPTKNFREAIYEEIPMIDESFVQEKLKKDFDEPRLKVIFPENKNILNFYDLINNFPHNDDLGNKLLLPELKMGSKEALGWHNPKLPLMLAQEIKEKKLVNNTVAISFYWWSPLVAKVQMFFGGIYLPT